MTSRPAGSPSALQRGLRLIERRPRTENELRTRLLRHHDPPDAERAIERLRQLGYLDDAVWARQYLERPRAETRGRPLLRAELRRHGVPEELAAEAIAAHDDESAAAAAAREALRRLERSNRQLDARSRALRLAGYLRRRGFDPGTAWRAIERVSAPSERA